MAAALVAVVHVWQAGALSQESRLDLFRKPEVLPEGRSNVEETALIAAKPPPVPVGKGGPGIAGGQESLPVGPAHGGVDRGGCKTKAGVGMRPARRGRRFARFLFVRPPDQVKNAVMGIISCHLARLTDRRPVANECCRFIQATFIPPWPGCKGNFSRFSACRFPSPSPSPHRMGRGRWFFWAA